MEKPNCFECIHRRDVPGDAHSSCAHPDAGGGNPMAELMSILAGVGRVDPVCDPSGVAKLNIRANPHGVRNGWFNFPWNFDPIWLLNCDGFTPKEAA